MLVLSLALFSLAILLGIYLLSFILQNKNTPKGVVFTHGPLAVTGLIILIIYALLYRPAPIVSIVIFALAGLGGFMMVFRDITGKSVPKWMALGHGITALVGFGFLVAHFMHFTNF